jgi:hypothetical protein
MNKVGDTISRVRNSVKAVTEDAFVTDRYLYSLILKYAKLYIKRLDDQNKIMRFHSLFTVIPCMELITVSKIEAGCAGIRTNCTIKRTKDKLPGVLEGTYGPLFRTISSIDSSIQVFKTYPATYVNLANSTYNKFNKTKYYWFLDGYLYFPNIMWEAVKIELLPEGSIAEFLCDGDPCVNRQEDQTHIPDYLFAEIEKNVLAELMGTIQIPTEGADNNMSNLRD